MVKDFGIFWVVLDNIDGDLSHLSNTGGKEVDDPLVRDGHHTLSVDLDDPVADPNSSPLRDASS